MTLSAYIKNGVVKNWFDGPVPQLVDTEVTPPKTLVSAGAVIGWEATWRGNVYKLIAAQFDDVQPEGYRYTGAWTATVDENEVAHITRSWQLVIPESISIADAKTILTNQDLLDAATAAFDASSIGRYEPLVQAIADALGKTSEEVDQFFLAQTTL